MEALLQTDAYNKPFGLQCLEVCIKDLNEATQDFWHEHENGLKLPEIPSWKFPNTNIAKVDVLSTIQKCRSLPESEKNQELLELLIDRVCFSLTVSCKVLETTIGIKHEDHDKSSDTVRPNSAMAHLGQGDSIKLTPITSKSRNLALTARPSKSLTELSALVTSGTHPNVGLLLKQLHEIVATIIIDRHSKTAKSHPPLLSKSSSKSTLIQTENNSMDSGCETCFVAQNLLKFIATTLTDCLHELSKTPSQVSQLRKSNKIWTVTQREFVYSFCEAIQADCRTLLQKGSELREKKTKLKKTVDDCKQNLEAEITKHANHSEDLLKQLNNAEEKIQKDKEKMKTLKEHAEEERNKTKDFEMQLSKKMNECLQWQAQVQELQCSLQSMNVSQSKIQEEHETTLQARNALEEEVASLKELKSSLEQDLTNCKTVIEEKDKDIENMTNSLEILKHEYSKKNDMKGLLEKAKKQLETCRNAESEYKIAKLADKEKMDKMEKDVAKLHEQIELLTLYPDLNGPINPPTAEEEDNPIQAMMNQVKSNQLRIEILQTQTEQMNATLSKLGKALPHLSSN